MNVLKLLKITAYLGVISSLAACAQQPIKPNAAEQLGAFPEQQSSHDRLAQASMMSGDYEAAVRLYKQRVKASPSSLDSYLKLAETFAKAGASDKAQQTYFNAIQLDGAAPEPWTGLGKISLSRARPYEAFEYFLKANARDPDNIESLNGMAVSRDYQGQHLEAQSLYRQMLDIRPFDLQIKSNLGLSMALGGEPQKAVQYLLGFAASPNAPIQARHNLALAYAMSGNTANAESVLSLDMSPGQIQQSQQYFKMIQSMMRCSSRNNCTFNQKLPYMASMH